LAGPSKTIGQRIRRLKPLKGHNRNMQEVSFEEALAEIQAKDRRYHRAAYLFVREALDHTQKTIAKDTRGRIRHVTGQELLGGIREFALHQFGPMAKTVLEEWGVRCRQDFGEIVFNMVEVGWLAKTEKDSRTDFQEGYDFDDAFVSPFLPKSKRTIQTPETKP
jgi:uncharacterized repeat protein (TIGR04138 family)